MPRVGFLPIAPTLFCFYFSVNAVKHLADHRLPTNQVREMGAAGVMDEIERIAVETALSIMEGRGFSFRVPNRGAGNQKYIEELDRIVLGDKVRDALAARGETQQRYL